MILKFRFVAVLFFTASTAFGFDQIYCESILNDWSISLTPTDKYSVLNSFNQNIKLSENQSEAFYLKNKKNELIAAIFPWNSLYIRKTALAQKDFDIKSAESLAGFFIQITDKKTKDVRDLSCRFTF